MSRTAEYRDRFDWLEEQIRKSPENAIARHYGIESALWAIASELAALNENGKQRLAIESVQVSTKKQH